MLFSPSQDINHHTNLCSIVFPSLMGIIIQKSIFLFIGCTLYGVLSFLHTSHNIVVHHAASVFLLVKFVFPTSFSCWHAGPDPIL
jgi:hypothetical protein